METSWTRFLALCLLFGPSIELQCRDDNNVPVDWFVIYKIPAMSSTNPRIRSGMAYVHVTSISTKIGWTLSEKDLTKWDSALSNTLYPLYIDNVAAKSIWVLYNDQQPGEQTSSYNQSQAKGVLMANERQGFWMIHSVPQFEAVPKSGVDSKGVRSPGGGYQYPPSGKMNAAASETQSARYSGMGVAEISSLNGHKFRTFAQSATWEKDLWDDLVAPSLASNLFLMAVPERGMAVPSKCTGNFTVENIKQIAIEEARGIPFYNNDDSKWAIARGGSWFCIGDVPRTTMQNRRSGGAVCLQARNLWVIFHRMIRQRESCP